MAVPVVGTAHQVVAGHGAVEVADVVQQGGRDQGRPGAVLLGQGGGLEHVRRLRDGLAEVLSGAFAGEQAGDDTDRPVRM